MGIFCRLPFMLETGEVCRVRGTAGIFLLAGLEADGEPFLIAQEQGLSLAKGAHELYLGLTQLKHLLYQWQARQLLCHDNTGGTATRDRTLQEHFWVLRNATNRETVLACPMKQRFDEPH